RAQVMTAYVATLNETGVAPTRPAIMEETGLSRATVTRHLAALKEAGMLPDK
ncbi:TPA: ArsR family transcriptional regulator, partial [Corynebacterium striatum]|nr:ArsR family transcriptional regulator [Corynebacterium striatum]